MWSMPFPQTRRHEVGYGCVTANEKEWNELQEEEMV